MNERLHPTINEGLKENLDTVDVKNADNPPFDPHNKRQK